MIDKAKYSLILITLMSLLTVFSKNGIGNEIKKGKTTSPSSESMNLEVIDVNGEVDFTDVVTSEDPILDFNLETMPAGTYTVQVSKGGEILNETKISNLSKDKNVFTIEVLNASGEKVYGSNETSETFNLDKMPQGEYVINIYRGQELINTNKLVQLNQLIVN